MKIVVIGGTGLIGSKLVQRLRAAGHEAVPASPNTGVNTLTGEGLAAAFTGAQVVVDVSNAPSFEDQAVMDFFRTSADNIAKAEAAAGVRHHVALSVVGTDRLQDAGYFRAKLVQEELIKASKIPYTIVRATQFFEFLGAIAHSGTVDGAVHLSPALVQPMAADDVADAMGDAALAAPLNGMTEIGGPEKIPLDAIVGRYLAATKDARRVIADVNARYFGLRMDDRTLNPGEGARLGKIRFETWLGRSVAAA